MNFKYLTALTLAASAAPLATAGPLAYALCQTGAFPPTIIQLCTHDITRLQRACSCVLWWCRFHFRGDHRCGAPRHLGVQCWPGHLHGSVCCDSAHCTYPLNGLQPWSSPGEHFVCPRYIQLTARVALACSSKHPRRMIFPTSS